MDRVSGQVRSGIMSKIRSKDTAIELQFRKELWKTGLRYRKNPSHYFGKPDVVIKKYKTVVFIDSCFWHGCKKHCRIPNSQKKYWKSKIKRNAARDREVSRFYKKSGWKIYRIWEHDIKHSNKIIKRISESFATSSK